LWKNRNLKIHHLSETNAQTARHTRIRTRVTDCWTRKPADLPEGDLNAYFDEPLEDLLQRPPHVLEAWVAHVDRIFIRHRNEVLQRSKSGLITHFFARTSLRSSQSHQTPVQ
jgi:hypothetical protein